MSEKFALEKGFRQGTYVYFYKWLIPGEGSSVILSGQK